MKEYTVEEKYVIDSEITKLSTENKVYFYNMYKNAKSEVVLTVLIIFLGLFGVPFIYLKGKFVKKSQVVTLFSLGIALLVLCILENTQGASFWYNVRLEIFSMILRPLYLVFIIYFFVYIRNIKDLKRGVDYYNYNKKAEILRKILV